MLWVLEGGTFIASMSKSKLMAKLLPIFIGHTKLLSKICRVTAEFAEG